MIDLVRRSHRDHAASACHRKPHPVVLVFPGDGSTFTDGAA